MLSSLLTLGRAVEHLLATVALGVESARCVPATQRAHSAFELVTKKKKGR